jgi:glutamate N-acetyltransferase/amino-acid N-acetyltransferase
MKKRWKQVSGNIVAPQGFVASGVFCDIKRLGTGKGSEKGQKRDLALIISELPAVAAGMFTTNQVCAAPVKVCLDHLRGGVAQAIVANSGNANACTGRQGLKDAFLMAELVAGQLQMPAAHVLVCSTGRIGVPLPMLNVKVGIEQAAAELSNSVDQADDVVEAIMTSDTQPKEIAVELRLGGKPARIGGICKGAGMIQPGMSVDGRRPAAAPAGLHATMLAFVTTDALIQPKALRRALSDAVAKSFNRITVDGDMSTNDTVLILANGLAENPLIRHSARPGSDFALFQEALDFVSLELAKKVVRDGEGVSRFVTVRIEGARSFADADAAARAVANSALVKTSWHGGDPNWGRIIDALGYSAATVVEGKVDIGYSAPRSHRIMWSLKQGQPTATSFKQLCGAVAAKEFDLHIRLNLGRFNAIMYAADLTEAYVDFNKGNVSDPTSLGG